MAVDVASIAMDETLALSAQSFICWLIVLGFIRYFFS